MAIESGSASIIIPTLNSGSRIGHCLSAILPQAARAGAEILVVNDGSTDNTAEVARRYTGVRVIDQANAGPAVARNRGVIEAKGGIVVFTDDDCVPTPGWLDSMLRPFEDPQVVGAKGVYRTNQKSVIARFVQLEYEDRYRLMSRFDQIDFVDTYSAAFRRDKFLEMGGYDTSFPVACAEDIELSYRMSARGWKMKFAPNAVVYHTHPDTLAKYLKKKYKFAYWRVLAVRKNPSKAVRDSHTPQLMKLQLLFAPALVLGIILDFSLHPQFSITLVTLSTFFASMLPFTTRATGEDRFVGLLSPLVLTLRGAAQLAGVAAGLVCTLQKPAAVATHEA